MGIFDKFSKKSTDKESKEETEKEVEKEVSDNKVIDIKTAKSEDVQAEVNTETVTEKPRTTRFPLVVDCIKELGAKGVIVGGNLHGTINVHDKIFVLHPMFKESDVIEIDGIELLEKDNLGQGEKVEFVSDKRVGLTISAIKDKNKAPKYSVVTNIIPQLTPHPKKPLDNPFLLGLTYEYPRLIQDRMFADLFTFTVFSTGYLTPVELDKQPVAAENGAMRIPQNSRVGFKLLSHPEHKDEKLLAVFTDFAALGKWKALFEDGKSPNSIILNFDKCAEIALHNGGYIINPFGPAPVFVSKHNIEYAQKMKNDMDKKIAEDKK